MINNFQINTVYSDLLSKVHYHFQSPLLGIKSEEHIFSNQKTNIGQVLRIIFNNKQIF